MDLYAYAQIEDLEEIAKKNGIDIPRLRGYRLMENEEPVSQDAIDKLKKECEVDVVDHLCAAKPFWSAHPEYLICWDYVDRLKEYYLTKNSDGEYDGIRWDRIHGWKRRVLKFELKKEKRKVQKQYDIWNKYAGQKGVLYIHSRMGGNNWKYYEHKADITNQPWFLDRVDDHWDTTYCDFYAKINESEE